jgi:ribonuclease P protein component
MIAKASRLPREEFRGRGYRTVTTPFFSLKAKNNSSSGVSSRIGLKKNRIGVVVGKSVDNRAVQRNFWERQAKSHLLRVPALGKDFLFIAYPKIKELTKDEFGKVFTRAIHDLL